jgi:DNA topoisomerase-1
MNLGKDPDSGLDVLLMRGPYGYYVQLGPTDPKAESKPKRAAWPKNTPVVAADLATALKLLALPRQLGSHPETGKTVEANVGPFGPYIKHDGAYKSIPKSDSVYDIALPRALELLAMPKAERGAAGRRLGPHPQDQQPVVLLSGRYGPYVKHGRVNATVPSDYDPASLSLEQALTILAAKQAKRPPGKSKPRTAKQAQATEARTNTSGKTTKGARGHAQTGRTKSAPPQRGAAARAAARPAKRRRGG